MSDTQHASKSEQSTPVTTDGATPDGFGMTSEPTTQVQSECDKAVASLDRAKANSGIDPVTGRSVKETQLYLLDMAGGLVVVDDAEKAKAAAICRSEGIRD